MTGAAGSGKSQVIIAVRSFFHHFCRLTCSPFDETSLYITATIGSVASLIKGTTADSADHLKIYSQVTEDRKDIFSN